MTIGTNWIFHFSYSFALHAATSCGISLFVNHQPTLPSPRKRSLIALLRQTAAAFIMATQTDRPLSRKESVELRSEFDCLFSLVEEGAVDPVALFSNAPRAADGSVIVHLPIAAASAPRA